MEEWPEKVRVNTDILTETEKDTVRSLLNLGQHHLFAAWDPPGTNDEGKHRMLAHVIQLNDTCAGGLAGYISRARTLLAAARTGDNPFQGWVPSVPAGIKLEPFTPQYTQYETAGIAELGHCGFILVAGGLGERLGYSGIKVELPAETITRTCYLQHYIEQILAIQAFYATPGTLLPLAIMVSEDTEAKTVDLLERHAYFGMTREQITILKQGKVPALISNQAQIALAGAYEIEAKPHGHGDVHSLMHSTGTARAWAAQGIRWVIFFQDTNGLSFHTLPAMLGVSLDLGLDVNSLAIPRVAKQAIGAITRLVHAAKREMTVNVEYNQLDPLLRATIAPTTGDTNDPATGHSPLPGNINQLLFRLEPYLTVLQETEGVMPEFVNPKYQDSTRTVFKKPTRLECMMQDYPRLLHSEDGVNSKVGFTMAPAWLCYSPCKNNPTDAAASIAQGIPAASPYTAESDQYQVWVRLLRLLGADITDAEPLTVLGITATPGPRLVIKPSSAIFPFEVRSQLLRVGKNVSITARSTLVVEGNVVLDSLVLDGALKVVAAPYTKIIVRAADTAVTNRGHRLRYLSPQSSTSDSSQVNEIDTMRGYLLEPIEVKEVRSEPGTAGGLIVYIFNGHHLVRCEEPIAADAVRGLGGAGGSSSVGAVSSGNGGGSWLSCLTIPC